MINFSLELIIAVSDAIERNPNLLDDIREKKYRISDTGFTYRQINSLGASNLLNDLRENDKQWRGFSLYDLLYLSIIASSKDFVTKNSKLQYLKTVFYEKTYVIETAPTPDKDPELLETIYWGEMAFIAILLNLQVGMFMYGSGKSMITDIWSDAEFRFGINPEEETYIFMLLSELFKDTVITKLEPAFSQWLGKLDFKDLSYNYSHPHKETSDNEKNFLSLLRNDNYSKITITKKSAGKMIVNCHMSVDGNKITPQEFTKLLSTKRFGSVKVNKRDGKSVSYEIDDIYKI